MEELNVNVESKDGLVTVLKGDAPKQYPANRDNPYEVQGGPGTVLEVLSKFPLKELDYCLDDDSFLDVDRDNTLIRLSVNQHESVITDRYVSKLVLSKQIQEFGINTGKNWTPFELANFIKMNRIYFDSKAKAMELVSLLRNFKAKVDKDIENADDTRGNKKVLLQQTVDSNIPDSFKITIPIFKGVDHQTVEIEIMIDASDFSCQLISPEAKDFTDMESSRIIDEELKAIKELHPNLKVIEVI